MKRSLAWSALLFALAITGAAPIRPSDVPETKPATRPSAVQVRFGYVDVYIDSGREPLAAYQFELKVLAGDVKIVGVERGDVAGFQDPPYYDPAALSQDRIIVAAFNTAENLPVGKVRVARLHLRIAGPVKPIYAVNIIVAGSKQGNPISASASIAEGETR